MYHTYNTNPSVELSNHAAKQHCAGQERASDDHFWEFICLARKSEMLTYLVSHIARSPHTL